MRGQALLLLMILEWKAPARARRGCLACLASRDAADPARGRPGPGERSPTRPPSADFVVRLVNDRDDEPAWKIPAATVDALAELLVARRPPAPGPDRPAAPPPASAKEQDAWDQAWSVHEPRFAPEIAAPASAGRSGEARAPVDPRPGQLRELAFGAYVGLVREQGGGRAARRKTASGRSGR